MFNVKAEVRGYIVKGHNPTNLEPRESDYIKDFKIIFFSETGKCLKIVDLDDIEKLKYLLVNGGLV
jgi:hypothetical protein